MRRRFRWPAVPRHSRSLRCIATSGRRRRGWRGCRLALNGCRCAGHDRFSGAMTGQVRKAQRRDHENNGGRGCGFAEKCRGTGTAEQGLAGTATEGCSHVRPFPGLEQDDHDQSDTNNNVNDDK